MHFMFRSYNIIHPQLIGFLLFRSSPHAARHPHRKRQHLPRFGVCAPFDHEKAQVLCAQGSPWLCRLPAICRSAIQEIFFRQLRQSLRLCSLSRPSFDLRLCFEYLSVGIYARAKLLCDNSVLHYPRTCRFTHYAASQNVRKCLVLAFRCQDGNRLLLGRKV